MNNKVAYFDINGLIYNADSCDPLNNAFQRGDIGMEVLARDHYPGYRLKDDELPFVKSIGYWNSTQEQNWDLGWHRNEGLEICFLEEGQLLFDVAESNYELNAGHLTITRPWLKHRIGDVGLSKLHWIILDTQVRLPHQQWQWPDWIVLSRRDIDELTNILQHNEQPVWYADADIKRCFIKIGNVIKNRSDERIDSKLKIYINELLVLLLDLFRKHSVKLDHHLVSTKRSVELFLKNVESHISSPLTVDDMAEYCGLGATQFSKYCMEITNRSPMKYFNELRLVKAHDMLLSMPEKSVVDIAYECGFSSNQYFTLIFKRRYHISPDMYRRMVKSL